MQALSLASALRFLDFAAAIFVREARELLYISSDATEEDPMPALIPPTYEDAKLVLRLYELRREEKLRAAREWFGMKFFPQSFEDVKAVALGVGVENTYYRMVLGYWDMAASFVAHGILHPELFFDSGGESLFLWAKIGEFVPQLRQETQTPRLLANVEKAIGMAPWTAERIKALRGRMAGYRERLVKAEKGPA